MEISEKFSLKLKDNNLKHCTQCDTVKHISLFPKVKGAPKFECSLCSRERSKRIYAQTKKVGKMRCDICDYSVSAGRFTAHCVSKAHLDKVNALNEKNRENKNIVN